MLKTDPCQVMLKRFLVAGHSDKLDKVEFLCYISFISTWRVRVLIGASDGRKSFCRAEK